MFAVSVVIAVAPVASEAETDDAKRMSYRAVELVHPRDPRFSVIEAMADDLTFAASNYGLHFTELVRDSEVLLRIDWPAGADHCQVEKLARVQTQYHTLFNCLFLESRIVRRAFRAIGSDVAILDAGEGTNTYAYDIDSSGRIVGSEVIDTPLHHLPALWQAKGNHQLPHLMPVPGYAMAISDNGLIGGGDLLLDRVLVYNLATHTTTLLPPAQGSFDIIADINRSGTAVGTTDRGRLEAVMWKNNQVVNLHALLPGAVESEPVSLNDFGVVVGWYKISTFESRGFIFDGSRMHNITSVANLPTTVLEPIEPTIVHNNGIIHVIDGNQKSFALIPD